MWSLCYYLGQYYARLLVDTLTTGHTGLVPRGPQAIGGPGPKFSGGLVYIVARY